MVAVLIFLFAFLVPLLFSEYQVTSYSYFLTTVLLCLSLSLIWGFTGIFSFCQASFFGMGGYLYGMIVRIIGGLTGLRKALYLYD